MKNICSRYLKVFLLKLSAFFKSTLFLISSLRLCLPKKLGGVVCCSKNALLEKVIVTYVCTSNCQFFRFFWLFGEQKKVVVSKQITGPKIGSVIYLLTTSWLLLFCVCLRQDAEMRARTQITIKSMWKINRHYMVSK